MARQVELRPITDYEGNRLLRIVRRSSGSVVTWRRAQMVLLAAQAMPVSQIAKVTFTSQDRVRDVIHNFNADGFDALYPRYRGGRPPTFTPAGDHRSSPSRSGRRSRRRRWPDRPITACRSRPGACTSWPTSWSPRGWSRTSATRVCAPCCERRACPFNG